MINAILACDDRGGIGKDGTLPWPKMSEDLAYFKRMTDSQTVVMGSATWQSKGMPKPLPGRKNVVVTLHPEQHPGADLYLPRKNSGLIDDLRKLEGWHQLTPVWIIGGAKLINEIFLAIDRFYLSRIPGDYNCDTFLPLERIESAFHRTVVSTGEQATYETWYRR